jgi:3-deoxy-D-arabino-heptulosonate 7-phosphate (DAHP) synthase
MLTNLLAICLGSAGATSEIHGQPESAFGHGKQTVKTLMILWMVLKSTSW